MRTAARSALVSAVAAVAWIASSLPAAANPDVYRAMGVDPAQVMSGTVVRSTVVPGSAKQVVCIVTYLTGRKEPARAANVEVGVFDDRDGRLVPVYERDLGEESGGYVGNGDLQVIDLDRDGINELVLSWDDFSDPLVDVRTGEVLVHDDGGLRTAWRGELEYDATKAARTVPRERRDRFERELDIAATIRSEGRTLWFVKTVVAVAGERLASPSRIEESFPLRASGP